MASRPSPPHHTVTDIPKRVGQSQDLCTAIAVRLLWYRAVVDHRIYWSPAPETVRPLSAQEAGGTLRNSAAQPVDGRPRAVVIQASPRKSVNEAYLVLIIQDAARQTPSLMA